MTAKVRLLVCLDEKTIEELPDYEGPAEKDDTLNWLISNRHTERGSGLTHRGQLMDVEAKHWDNEKMRAQIIAQIREGAQFTGLDPSFYDAKNTLQEDAMTCWTRDHNRDPACSDYKSEKKLLKPDTKGDRADLGLSEYRSTTYLCDFCPVKSLVQKAYYDKSGDRN